MTLTLWTFTLSGGLLLLFSFFVLFEYRRGMRSWLGRSLEKASPVLFSVSTRAVRGVESFGARVLFLSKEVLLWVLLYGARALVVSIRYAMRKMLMMARSRGVIKKRGTASLFLKQISEHKREHRGGEIEEY